MKIFVVGGAGYIGSVCTELLLDEGHEVAIFDNLIEGHRRAVDSRVNFIRGELADRAQIESALTGTRPDAVMHFAAYALVPESMRDPSKYFRNNISNGLNLLDAMLKTEVRRIIFSSTCAIFGPPDRVPIDESAVPRPISPYGESKLAFEKILRWYDEIHGFKFVSLRYFNAAGATGRSRSVKARISKSTGPITRRLTAHAFAITSTLSILRTRTFWRLGQPPAASTTLARAAAPVFRR